MRNRHISENGTTITERAEMVALRLTRPQIEVTVRDTRLPGEIASSYKTMPL